MCTVSTLSRRQSIDGYDISVCSLQGQTGRYEAAFYTRAELCGRPTLRLYGASTTFRTSFWGDVDVQIRRSIRELGVPPELNFVSLHSLSVKPGFHPNAIACVDKQPIMIATASTEHPIGCKQQPIGCSVEAVAIMIGCLSTQAIAFGWKPGLSQTVV